MAGLNRSREKERKQTVPRLPKLIGHRGAAAQAPENTLAGIRIASGLGLRWVEFDVRLTRDRRLVLFHDATLGRTTGTAGSVAGSTLADILHLDAGSWFGPAFTGEPVPLLEDALDLLAECGMGANIEIKADDGAGRDTADALASFMLAHPPKIPLLLSSFLPGALEVLRDRLPDIPRGLLLKGLAPGWRDRATRFECASVHVGERALVARNMARVKAGGWPLVVYTVNDPARAQALVQAGAAAIITDAPAAMLDAFGVMPVKS